MTVRCNARPDECVVKKDSSLVPSQFYLVFDYVDNDLAGIVRAVKKQLLPP